MITKRRRAAVAVVIAAIIGAVVALSVIVTVDSIGQSNPAAAAASAGPSIHIPRAAVPTQAGVTNIPVLTYHEMNNGCAATAAICDATDPESVSTTQFSNEMNYLGSAGYHTVSLAQYEAWLADPDTRLPRKPILLTDDNGIGNFLVGAQSMLATHAFTMTAFIVTGFADGASGICQPDLTVAGRRYNVQPGCGTANRAWDLTWAQLKTLNPGVYSFALEAGPSGHFVQNYSATCAMFDACMIPGETTGQYQARVSNEITSGLAQLNSELPGRVNRDAWVVPYSDLGYLQCAPPDCTSQASTGPAGWLPAYAAAHFSAVFVEDAFRNGVQHERFRFDINGSVTESHFEAQLQTFVSAGSFNH
jgi:hypothetical protein